LKEIALVTDDVVLLLGICTFCGACEIAGVLTSLLFNFTDRSHPLLVGPNLGQDHLSSTIGVGGIALTLHQLDAPGSTDHDLHQDLTTTQSMGVTGHIGTIGTSIAGLGEERVIDPVIIIHLVQGGTEVEV
jgi:hypothetical protein